MASTNDDLLSLNKEKNTIVDAIVTSVVKEENKGIACIKKEYIIERHVPKLAINCISESDKNQLNKDEPPSKKQKCSKNVLKGQNKSRNSTYY